MDVIGMVNEIVDQKKELIKKLQKIKNSCDTKIFELSNEIAILEYNYEDNGTKSQK